MSPESAYLLQCLNDRIAKLDARFDRLTRAVENGATARAEDDDGWTRLPRPSGRCPVSGWSRSTVMKRITEGLVRAKSIGGARYYAAKDIQQLLKS